MTTYCSCGKTLVADGELTPLTVGGTTHCFDGSPCFPRCQQIAVYALVRPGEIPDGLVGIAPGDNLVTCELPIDHPLPHSYPDIPGLERRSIETVGPG